MVDQEGPLIAVVDDDPDLLALVGLGLESAGYRWLAIPDGSEAVATIRAARPALILLDVRLPGVDGMTLLDQLASDEASPNVPILMMTAIDSIDQLVDALHRGAIDYLRKPFVVRELVARVAAALRLSGQHHELKAQARRAEWASQIDPVTGGANRAHLEDAMRKEWERAAVRGDDLSVLLIDLDGFKDVNDSHGHRTGDRVLAEIAGLLRSRLRIEDWFGRWGGDEFLALLPATRLDEAAIVAGRLVSTCREWSLTHTTKVTISCGVASLTPTEGRSVEELLATADASLYEAKQAGRDTYRANVVG